MLDLLIRDVTIVDGTGKPAYRGHLAVKDGILIQAAEGDCNVHARRTIAGAGLTATPGFVDMHRHGDLVPFREPEYEELRQGITTFFCGNCGFSAAPSTPEHFARLQDYARPIMGDIPPALSGAGCGELLARAGHPLPGNIGYLGGGGALRVGVKGFDPAPMQTREMEMVTGLLRESLEAGIFGLSLGLMYVPENFYTTKELTAICRVAAKMNRLVTVHIRGEGSSLLTSISEVLEIARRSGASMHISHLKAAGRKNWRTLIPRVLEMIACARDQGLDISFDVYPYTAGSTALYTLLPPALQSGGVGQLLERLRDPAVRATTAAALAQEQDSWDNLVCSTGWRSVVLAGGGDERLVGRSILEIADERGCAPADLVMDLLLENGGDVPIVFYSMCEEDVELVLGTPGAIVISDALYTRGGQPHPRRYGAHARLLHRYAPRIGLERAVRAATSLPARRMGLREMGRLEQGCRADILLLDMENLRDTATYTQPRQYPTGIHTVVLNGEVALENGAPTGCHGQLLTPHGPGTGR